MKHSENEGLLSPEPLEVWQVSGMRTKERKKKRKKKN